MKHQTLFCPPTEVLNIRLKYLATICNGQDYKDVVDDDGEYPVIGSGGPFARATDYLYDQASVLLGRKGTIDNPLYVDYPFWTVDTMFYTRVKSIVSAKYLYYLAKTIPFDYYKYGSAIPSMTQRDLGNICFPVPRNDDVKNKIVDYLDSRTAAIDRVLSEKKTLIELLQEKKTSMICAAVVKGIHSDVALKDSFVDWLGEIPAHWEVVPAKALFSQSKETRHENDVQLTASQKYGIISQEDYMALQNSKIVLADKGLENWKHVEPNDFIISLRSFQGGLEISYIPGCITWHYIVLKPSAAVDPEYFKWLFKSPRYIQALQRTANFIRDGQDLRFSNFVQVPLPLIPMDEQREIAEYLNRETARIDSIIADVTEQIEKLREYRQSIISEVVTGKVAVE